MVRLEIFQGNRRAHGTSALSGRAARRASDFRARSTTRKLPSDYLAVTSIHDALRHPAHRAVALGSTVVFPFGEVARGRGDEGKRCRATRAERSR